jgi:Ca-activated chloride channel family protein
MNTPLSFKLQSDCNLIAREEPSERIVEISLSAPPSRKAAQRAPLNLALMIDRSGSMSGEKLDYVRQAAAHVVSALSETDSAALVVFDDEVDLLCPSAPVTAEHRARLLEAIHSIHSGGTTNLCDGWLRGCKEIAASAKPGQLVRALLLTDGLANVGITDPEELAGHARELFARGISTSTFGVGLGFNEHLLEAMANQGGGNFYYIQTPAQIVDLFNSELQGLLAVTARAVEVRLDLPTRVSVQVLGSWRHTVQGSKVVINLGDLNQGATREVYLKLIFPPGEQIKPLVLSAQVLARGEDDEVLSATAIIAFRRESAAVVRAAARDQQLLNRFALVYIADVASRTLKLEREGLREEARRLLEPAVQEFGMYLDEQNSSHYRALSDRLRRGLDEFERKNFQYVTYLQKQSRPDPKSKP